jgi:adenylyltransferase and sulfurtransferase
MSEGEQQIQEDRIRELEAAVKRLEEENRLLKQQQNVEPSAQNNYVSRAHAPCQRKQQRCISGLSRDDIERYSRQLLLSDGFGVAGQLQLQQSSVLVVGAGGIGSTVLLYLGAAGVGRIGVADCDVVEVSNLHRQIIHSVQTVGEHKAVSARQAVLDLNPSVVCEAMDTVFTAENALQLVGDYDCVVDATDNPATRYLINDACVLAGKPLVSGSAVGTQGQLTVYNSKGGSCYRCLYPKPSIQAGCHSCSDAGVLGPVPGLIGILQAMETLKILTGFGSAMHDRLLMYDGAACSFVNVKKPAKREDCPVCGSHPTIQSMCDSQNNLTEARGPTNPSSSLPAASSSLNELNLTCQEYARIREQPHVLLDVRVERQFEMCALPGAVNIPLERLPNEMDRIAALSGSTKPVFCICRRGIASAEAARIIHKIMTTQKDDAGDRQQQTKIHSVRNIEGGLVAWQAQVDPAFPKY